MIVHLEEPTLVPDRIIGDIDGLKRCKRWDVWSDQIGREEIVEKITEASRVSSEEGKISSKEEGNVITLQEKSEIHENTRRMVQKIQFRASKSEERIESEIMRTKEDLGYKGANMRQSIQEAATESGKQTEDTHKVMQVTRKQLLSNI